MLHAQAAWSLRHYNLIGTLEPIQSYKAGFIWCCTCDKLLGSLSLVPRPSRSCFNISLKSMERPGHKAKAPSHFSCSAEMLQKCEYKVHKYRQQSSMGNKHITYDNSLRLVQCWRLSARAWAPASPILLSTRLHVKKNTSLDLEVTVAYPGGGAQGAEAPP